MRDLAEYKARKMEAYREWVDPEAVARRAMEHEEAAEKALQLGKMLARDLEVFPVPDPLSPHMKGQSPATIQAMLRQERDEKAFRALMGNPITEKTPSEESAAPTQVTILPVGCSVTEIPKPAPQQMPKHFGRRFLSWIGG